jgi:predicted histone-like DNA-binding protein
MSIKFVPTAKSNVNNPKGPKLYYPGLVKGDEVSYDEMIQEIGKLSGINEPYIEAVLLTLEKVMVDQLSHGRYVKLGRLGTFYLTFKSNGVESPEKLSAKNIEGLNIRFKPAKRILDALKGFTFKKVRRKG